MRKEAINLVQLFSQLVNSCFVLRFNCLNFGIQVLDIVGKATVIGFKSFDLLLLLLGLGASEERTDTI